MALMIDYNLLKWEQKHNYWGWLSCSITANHRETALWWRGTICAHKSPYFVSVGHSWLNFGYFWILDQRKTLRRCSFSLLSSSRWEYQRLRLRERLPASDWLTFLDPGGPRLLGWPCVIEARHAAVSPKHSLLLCTALESQFTQAQLSN